jgi:tRNA(Ile)-lysidine synthase TilS/MesJ
MAALGIPYFYEEQCIIDTAAGIENLASLCSFCARMKRGRLYATARREGFNVLAFGQHLVRKLVFFFVFFFLHASS